MKEDGSLWFTMKIKSVPAPHAVKWSMKENVSDNFQPVIVSDVEYKGTTTTFPHPVLVIKHPEKLNNCIFKIEVKNRIGEVNRRIQGKNVGFRNIPFITVFFYYSAGLITELYILTKICNQSQTRVYLYHQNTSIKITTLVV